jgi:hypothetical protein
LDKKLHRSTISSVAKIKSYKIPINNNQQGKMKRQLMTLAAMAMLATSALGQGQVTVGNNASSLIMNGQTSAASATGSLLFQLYYAAGSGIPEGSLQPVGATVQHSPTFAGRIANTIVDIPLAPGSAATFQIWAWQSSFATYAAAASGGGLIGKSITFNASTSPGGAPPPLPTALAGLYPGFTVNSTIIPEPSTFVLAGLGVASLLLFRRRK